MQITEFLKRYNSQLIIYLLWVNNQISNIWIDNEDKYISPIGIIGWSKEYHYWLTFDHQVNILIILIAWIVSIKYPLEDRFKSFKLGSVIAIFCIILVEDIRVQLYGNNAMNEYLFVTYIVAYTVSLIVMSYFYKLWKK